MQDTAAEKEVGRRGWQGMWGWPGEPCSPAWQAGPVNLDGRPSPLVGFDLMATINS